MERLYEICEFLATLCEFLLIMWFFTSFFGLKKPKLSGKIMLIGIAVFMAVFCTIYYTILPNENRFITLIDIAVYFLICNFFFNGKYINHFLMAISAETVVLLIAMAINSVSTYISDKSSAEIIKDRDAERIMVLIFSKLLLFLAYKIILIVTQRNKPQLKQGEWVAFGSVFTSTLLCGICIYESRFDSQLAGNTMFFILPTFGLIVINIVSFYMIVRISKEHRENIHLSTLNVQIKEQETSLQEIKSLYSEMRKVKHDLEGQYGCLSELLSNAKYEQAKQYLNSMKSPDFTSLVSVSTDSDILNAVIGYLYNKCKAEDIHLQYIISSSDIDDFSPADISVIITNLVNNAYEACLKNNVSEISLELSEQRNYFCITVKNRIKESVLLKNPNLKTTKVEKDIHGFGIESVKMLAEKYGGITDFSESNGYFLAEIWLKRPIRKN